jgi:hemerythrin
MKVEWKDSYKIGNAEIDQQHQELFALINALLVPLDEAGLKSLIMKLYRHTREHFEAEEALIRKLKFVDCKGHTNNHNSLLARLNQISSGVGKGRLDQAAFHALMHDWAMRHVVIDDAPLARCIAEQSSNSA